MSTMTVTLYSTTANTAATAARPERFDLIMVLPLGSGNIHKTRTPPLPPPQPRKTLLSNAPCSVLRIFQIIITMLLWQITAVHLRAPVSCVRFAAQQRTCCALQFSVVIVVVAVVVVCGVSLCRRASSQVRMPQQVKLKLPRALALGGILSTQMSSSGSSSSNRSAAVRDSRPQCGCGDARITTLVCVCVWLILFNISPSLSVQTNH